MTPQAADALMYEGIAEAYESANGPFEVACDGKPGFIVMRTSDLEEEEPLSDAEKTSLLAGYKDYLDGNVVDAHELISEIRGKYGL
ncbi:hypothetical protein [Enorma phocaeensis]|uniref:hypothetical protein n=1 Tax=Enorma phocaeensis TaxID=1871019 RepID=UPI002355BC4F|nr:hypothetical protein [Enorma phocaeensis]